MLLGIMLTSLVFSASLPDAFTTRAAAVAIAFVVIQVGRTVFVILALPGHPLRRNFERILVWTTLSSVGWIAGVFTAGHAREALWAVAIAVDMGGGEVGFYAPGLGRSATSEWNIEVGHFAERCQAFVLIALGESVVAIGASLSGLRATSAPKIASFVVAFIGCVALWWIYFDRSAEEAATHLASSTDPGRLGRSAYHFIHPIMVAGIVVIAAADDRVLDHPLRTGNRATALMVLGGTLLFVLGHALFKRAIWGVVSVSRIVAILVLLLSAGLAPFVPAYVLAVIATVVVVGIGVADRLLYGAVDPTEAVAPAQGRPS
jgi:low temperature requirement protein LtrA